MIKLAANLSTMFTEWPLGERIEQAARCGFKGVEFQFLDTVDAARDLTRQARDAGVETALINAPCGDRAAGEFGLAGVPGREEHFARSILDALGMAAHLECPAIHVLSGKRQDGVSPSDQWRMLVGNLRAAAAMAAPAGVTLLIEPLNERSMPDYLLPTLDSAIRLQDEVAAPNLKIQFDLFHLQIMGGDILTRFAAVRDRVGHIQLAAVPHRDEPDRGELAYERVLDTIASEGYSGWIGCEYFPRAGTIQGLGWASRYGISAA